MEHVDLLYSGLILTALMLSIWAALLVTAACVFFAPNVFGSSLPARVSNHMPLSFKSVLARGSRLAAQPPLTSASPAGTISSRKKHVSPAVASTCPLP